MAETDFRRSEDIMNSASAASSAVGVAGDIKYSYSAGEIGQSPSLLPLHLFNPIGFWGGLEKTGCEANIFLTEQCHMQVGVMD